MVSRKSDNVLSGRAARSFDVGAVTAGEFAKVIEYIIRNLRGDRGAVLNFQTNEDDKANTNMTASFAGLKDMTRGSVAA